MPKILDDCVDRVMKDQGFSKSRAFAICTSSLQKAGTLKKGTQDLTKKGQSRSALRGAMNRAESRRS